MMNDLQLYKSETFGSFPCDIWKSNNSILMTRKQIGEALEYSDPQKAIDKIHSRYRNRLDKFSVTVNLVGTDGKVYDTTLYTHKGIFEICRWSRQPKADMFIDWVWDKIEEIIFEDNSLYKQLLEANNYFSMNQVAKSIKLFGRNKLFNFLRNENILMSSVKNWNLPYQKIIDCGYFDVIIIPKLIGGNAINIPVCVVKPKGIVYITKRLKKKGLLQSKAT